MRRLALFLIGWLLLVSPAGADDTQEVERLIKEKVHAIFSTLQNDKMSRQERNRKIIEIVDSAFDFDLMARLSLGQKYWPGLSDQEKKQFTDLFVQRIQESYLEKMDLYTDEKVVYDRPQQVKSRVHMPTHLVSKEGEISMIYKLYKSDKGWKIYDLEIQGVSVIQTYRSQFDSVLSAGTFAQLLEKLKSPDEFHIDAPEASPDTAIR